MRTLRLSIAYDGRPYAGWQVQTKQKQPQHATIQGTLEHALSRIAQEKVRVVGSGRTDAGVHALAQVAHIKIRNTISRERMLKSCNQLLPKTIAVLDIQEAAADFHARFSVRSKHYRYRMCNQSVVNPFDRPYVYALAVNLNIALMRREALALVGEHDFKAFSRAGSQRSTVRILTSSRLLKRKQELWYEVEGNGFLHNMVRSIVGTLIDIGRGHLAAGTIRKMLQTGKRELSGATAPACGLCLVSVSY